MIVPDQNPDQVRPEVSATRQITRLNQLLRALREVGRILNREKNLPALLQQVCDCLAQNRGYVGVWIGQPDLAAKKIIPLAAAGAEPLEQLRQMDIRWEDSRQGQSPAGTAVRERRPVVFAYVAEKPGFAPWRENVQSLGASSAGSFPMLCQDRLFGVLTLNSRRPHQLVFDPEEIELLSDLAADVARAWQGIEDETALRASEIANREGRDFYLRLLQTAPALIWRELRDARCDWFNEAWLRFTGRSLDQECLAGWGEGIHPEDRAEALRRHQAALPEHLPFVLEYRLRRHDGEYRWITDHGMPYFDAHEDFSGYMGFCHDVHEEKMSAQRARESAHQLRAILDGIPDSIWVKDGTGRFLLANSALLANLKSPVTSLVGKTVFDIFPAEQAERMQQLDGQILQTGETIHSEEYLMRSDGTGYWSHTYKRPFLDQKGRAAGTLGISRDVSRLKMSELELARAKQELVRINAQLEERVRVGTQMLGRREEQLQRLFANMVEGIATLHLIRDEHQDLLDLKFGFLNPAFEKVTGLTALAGKKLTELPSGFIPRPTEWLEGISRVAATGQPWRWEIHLDQRQIWLSVKVYHNGPGEVVGVFDDITDRKQYQAALEQGATHLKHLVQAAPIPLCCFNSQGEFTQVNECFLRLFGFPTGQPPGAAEWWRTVLPEQNPYAALAGWPFNARELARQFGAHQLPCSCVMRCRDGSVSHVDISCVELDHTLLVVFVDNTANHLIQEVLQENEERWEYALSGAEDGVWDWDVASAKVFYAIKWKEMLGYLDHEIGDSLTEFSSRVHPADQPRIDTALQAHINGEQPGFRAEIRLRCRDDSYKWILTRGKIVRRGPADQPLRIIGTHTDISSLKQTEEALRESLAKERQLSDVIERSAMPFCIGDPQGALQMVNRAFEELTGFNRAELNGNPDWFRLVTPPEHLEASVRLVRQSLLTRQSFAYEKELLRKDGSRVPVELLVQPIFDEAGNHLHFRAFIKDISERKKAARELEIAMDQANQASQAKSEFLASLSHELRTPLNAILGYAQILRRQPEVSPATREKLGIINRSGENLLTILNDILDLAKIEAGQMTLLPTEFHLPAMLEDLVRLFRPSAGEKGLTLKLTTPGDLPAVIRTDEIKLRQILCNLLGNAIKFTASGQIEVHVQLVASPAPGTQLHLAVQDTGPGIAPGEIPLLFEKFQQTQAGRDSLKGIGLGLALCRQFARLLGGDISVTSQPGVGSTFAFHLPVEVMPSPGAPRPPKTKMDFVLPPNQPAPLVLVVDDVQENRDVLRELLAGAGLIVQTVENGAAALAACRASQPQLVLMDTRMPVMDGYETIRRLRAEFHGTGMKIITVSAAAYAGDRAKARLAGADDFLAKPVNAVDLFAKIGTLLQWPVKPSGDTPTGLFAADSQSARLSPASVAALPAAWRTAFRDALILGDFRTVGQLLALLLPDHPVTTAALGQLADQFDADALLQLFPAEANDIN